MTRYMRIRLFKHTVLMVAAVLATATKGHAAPVPIPGLKPTGVSSGILSTVLPAFAVDPHYTLIQALGGFGPNAFVASPRPASWVANQPFSEWISPDGINTPLLSGLYVYQLQFDLTGLDPSTASISGLWTADDNSRVVLNGNFGAGIIQTTTFSQFDSFAFNSGFVPGINTLDFRVGNAFFPGINLGGPSGLHVTQLTGAAEPIPEPGSLALLALGVNSLLKRNQNIH